MADIRIFSCCKINLFLQVTGRREDNYHTLQTLFLPVKNVADVIDCSFDAAAGIEVNSLQPDVPSGRDNLIYRVAEKFAVAAGIDASWRFTLDKRVPVSAGLGGGSSNAAAVLRALNDHYKLLNRTQMHDLAVSVGADVPFFLDAVPAWAGGIGDKLEAVNASYPPLHLVLVNPGFPVGVRWTYSQLDPAKFAPADAGTKNKLTAALLAGDVSTMAALCRNDLGEALWSKFPQLALLKKCMLKSGAACVQVSGSGPTLFALCGSKEIQAAVAAGVRAEFKNNCGIRVFECEA